MKSETSKELDLVFEGFIKRAFQEIPLDGIENYVHENIMGFGTTAEEEVYSFDDFIEYMRVQKKQSKDIEFSLERELIHKLVHEEENLALIAEQINVIITPPDGKMMRLYVRMSTVLSRSDGQWKVVHWHGSIPSESENDVWHVKEWEAEKEKLEKKVAEQTADLQKQNMELEIEACSERIRTRAMEMDKPEDIQKVLKLIKEEIDALEMGQVSTWLWTFSGDGIVTHLEFIDLDLDGNVIKGNSVFDPKKYSATKIIAEKRGEDFFSLHFKGNAVKDYLESVSEIEPEKTKPFRDAIESGRITEFWLLGSSFAQGIFGFDFIDTPPENAKQVVVKITEAFGLAYKRYEDLQQAEKRLREAELEAASERVRTHAMGMQESEDFSDVLWRINHELRELQLVGQNSTYIWVHENEDQYKVFNLEHIEQGASSNIHTASINSNDFKFFRRQTGDWKEQPEFFITYASKEQLYEFMMEFRKFEEEEFLDFADKYEQELDEGNINEIWAASAGFGAGFIGGDFLQEPDEWIEKVLRKMASAFGMAYQRFEDLQKAEERAREAEVETSLERVRSRTSGMQSSEELSEVAVLIGKELRKLGFPGLFESGYIEWLESENIQQGWMSDFEGQNMEPFKLPLKGDPVLDERYEGYKNQASLLHQEVGGQNLMDHLSFALPSVTSAHVRKQVEEFFSDPTHFYHSFFKDGALNIICQEKLSKEQEDLFIRFTKVFRQTYARFKDLKRAEEQAKESRIELSLERIRAQATAMQKSTDLLDIVVSMRKEFLKLGNEAHYFWHMKWLPDSYEKAMTSGSGNKIGMVMTLPRHIHGDVELVAEWEKGDEPTLVFPMDTETAVDYVDKMISLGDFERIDPNAPSLDDIRHIGGLTFVMARTTHGEIGYSLPGKVTDPPEEGINILKRFAGAFDLAYRRFEDLLLAEQQAYESKVEASLERVRGMAAAMNHSDDLMQIAEAMFKEMEILKITPLRYGLGMIEDNKEEAELWASTVNDGHYLDLLGKISLTWHPMLQKALDAWDAQHEELVYKLEGKERAEYYERVTKINPQIPDSDKLIDPDSGIEQYCSFLPFKTGILYAFTRHHPNEEGLSILKRFANVFEQAFTRYEDLQKTEKQARMIREERDRLEQTLNELHATKDQLVQQEKLASLGQLTAGIAHEIKNPLNFVNNFSDLSTELVDEIREELNALKDPENEHIEEINYILNDIQANLGKIHEHGTRADSIVKSMLQHSRGGTGSLESTDLNALLKEYVNLAFHGMRAGKEPINLDIDLQLDDSLSEFPLIAEDFSRVVLNLCNNAFDAMRDKLTGDGGRKTEEGYKPKLTVRTYSEGNTVTIEIEDNGPGIPEEIKDKILQPFFTTKKGTAGTGLGLSITHDIIKAHGGSLSIRSAERSTVFEIKLIK